MGVAGRATEFRKSPTPAGEFDTHLRQSQKTIYPKIHVIVILFVESTKRRSSHGTIFVLVSFFRKKYRENSSITNQGITYMIFAMLSTMILTHLI